MNPAQTVAIIVGTGVLFLAARASAAQSPVFVTLAPPAQPYEPLDNYDDTIAEWGEEANYMLPSQYSTATSYDPNTYYDEWGFPIDNQPDYGGDTVLNVDDYIDPYDKSAGLMNISFSGGNVNFKVGEYPTYADQIAHTEQRYGLPVDLLARLLYQESRYRQDIISGATKSRVGAAGIAQFMPATARDFGIDPLDPIASIDAAGKYLSRLYRTFKRWDYALAAYNWGPGNMAKYIRGEKTVMPAETKNYVAQITTDVPVTVA